MGRLYVVKWGGAPAGTASDFTVADHSAGRIAENAILGESPATADDVFSLAGDSKREKIMILGILERS